MASGVRCIGETERSTADRPSKVPLFFFVFSPRHRQETELNMALARRKKEKAKQNKAGAGGVMNSFPPIRAHRSKTEKEA